MFKVITRYYDFQMCLKKMDDKIPLKQILIILVSSYES